MRRNVFFSSIMVIVLAISTPISVKAFDTNIPIKGFIGLDDETDFDNNLNPEMIDITLTNDLTWQVTSENRDVISTEHFIQNNSNNVVLRVTLISFTPTNDAARSLDGLVLGLTDDLEQDNIVGYINNDRISYENLLETNSEWKFSFSGRYEGIFPVPALQPTYSMVLNFEVAGLRP